MKLFNKKKEKAPEEQAESQGASGLSIARLMLFLFLATALAAALAGFLAYGQLAAQADRIQLQKQIAVAERMAAKIEGRLAALHGSLQAVATDKALVGALREGDRAGMGELLARYRQHFSGVLSLRLLAPEQSEPNPRLKPALGYACLEQATQVGNKGASPQAQVHRYGSEDQHIDLIHAVRDGDELLGYLQLTLEVAPIEGWLQGEVPAGALTELRQRAAGASLLLGSEGNAALQAAEPLHAVAIAGSSWELQYRNNYQGLLPEAESIGFVAIFGVLVGVLALIAAGFSVVLTRMLHADLVGLVKYCIALLNNERTHSSSLRLREFQRATKGLDGYVAKHPPRPQELHLGAQPAPESGISVEEEQAETTEPAAKPEEDSQEADLPDVMFMDSDNIKLEEQKSSDENK